MNKLNDVHAVKNKNILFVTLFVAILVLAVIIIDVIILKSLIFDPKLQTLPSANIEHSSSTNPPAPTKQGTTNLQFTGPNQ